MTNEELKDLMDANRLSAETIATWCFVSIHAVYRWRHGDRAVPRHAEHLIYENLRRTQK